MYFERGRRLLMTSVAINGPAVGWANVGARFLNSTFVPAVAAAAKPEQQTISMAFNSGLEVQQILLSVEAQGNITLALMDRVIGTFDSGDLDEVKLQDALNEAFDIACEYHLEDSLARYYGKVVVLLHPFITRSRPVCRCRHVRGWSHRFRPLGAN